ncbi:MAG: hypothetical protein AAF215_31330 [Cyanobacteria bacterium P01_A01_bin.123]
MKLKTLLASTAALITTFLLPAQALAETPPVPAADQETPFYDRHKIDISNLFDFYEGLLISDAMIHADAMFDAETKWRLTLRQMVLAGSGHHTARSAYQLSLMGVPLAEIHAIFAPDYAETLENPRLKAAFTYIDVMGSYPITSSADIHALLRTHYPDRQIAELMQLGAINNAKATHDAVLPIATDQETLDWAVENLSAVGWIPGPNASSSPEEQRTNPFIGNALTQAVAEIDAGWVRDDLGAVDPVFETDWVNYITGYDVPTTTFDGDQDGIEEPFDAFPTTLLEWEAPGSREANLPPEGTPPFNVAAYDYDFYDGPHGTEASVPYSDRSRFDTYWARQAAFGTLTMDEYILQTERTMEFAEIWSMFFVYQLASGCVHCQAHGAFGIYDYTEADYFQAEIPPEDRPALIAYIQSLMDFERSRFVEPAQRAALRLARDAGRLPTRVTAAHIEELRRHFTDREIQEILAIPVVTAWLSGSMQSMAVVTDQLSMSWAMRHLGPMGWTPGVHIGLPNEQRPRHMSQLMDLLVADMNTGKVPDAATEWTGLPVPLAVDTDRDGVEDAFDGFPNDPSRWADTDRDGIEDSSDDDIDGDGIANTEEVALGIFPYKADSDGDGVDDPTELDAGTDPVDPRSL